MNMNIIKEKINSDEYNFLREKKELKNIALLTVSGSIAYGTNHENSDIDLRGFYLNTKKDILTLNCESSIIEDKKTDTVIYSIKSFFKMLAECSPNIIELLGINKEHILISKPESQLIFDNKDLFISQFVGTTYSSYARQQLYKLQNSLLNISNKNSSKQIRLLNTIDKRLNDLQDNFLINTNGDIKFYLNKLSDPNLAQEILLDINLKGYSLLKFKTFFNEIYSIVSSFDKPKKNQTRSETSLLKDAMHLIRILIMGTEILSGKGINTYRENDKNFLLDISRGKYSYDEIFEMIKNYEDEFEYAQKNSSLPISPYFEKIDELKMQINKSQL